MALLTFQTLLGIGKPFIKLNVVTCKKVQERAWKSNIMDKRPTATPGILGKLLTNQLQIFAVT